MSQTSLSKGLERPTQAKQIDYVQEAMGSFGKYQFTLFLTLCLVKVSVAWHQLSIIFLAPPQEFSCQSLSNEVKSGGWQSASDKNGSCTANDSSACSSWDYDQSIFASTIISEWDLVCGRAAMAEWAQTAYMFGILVGSFVFGFFADRYGRKPPLVLSLVLQVISGAATAFADAVPSFIVLRIVDAFATGGVMVTTFVLIMECVGEEKRPTLAFWYHVPFSLGHATLPAVSFLFPNWRHFQLFISLPSIVLFSYYWLVMESPKWLLATGKLHEATEIAAKAAKANGLDTSRVPQLLAEQFNQIKVETTHRGTFLDLFRYPNLRLRTICISANWVACGISFFGLAQYMGQITGNIFLNVTIGGLIAIPSSAFGHYIVNIWGRRKTLLYSQTLIGVACLLIPLAHISNLTGQSVWLSAIGILGCSISFPTVYLYSAELFPTVVRNVGVGFGSTCARIGSMVAPFVIVLKIHGEYLPALMFGIMTIVGALLVLFLPETKGSVLPDTIAEGEAFLQNKEEDTSAKSI